MRIRTYGCSYTKYIYPTYADILGLDNEVVNQGIPGGGNERIFYLLMKDIREKKLKKTDAVIVQWSGPHRFDYLQRNNIWLAYGNIINPDNKNARAIWHRIRSWYNPDYELEKTYNYVNTTFEILKTYGCKKVYLSLTDLSEQFPQNNFLEYNMFEKYKGGYEFSGNTFDPNAAFIDDHPTMLEHLDIAQRIAETIGCNVSSHTERTVKIMDHQIKEDKQFVDRELQPSNR